MAASSASLMVLHVGLGGRIASLESEVPRDGADADVDTNTDSEEEADGDGGTERTGTSGTGEGRAGKAVAKPRQQNNPTRNDVPIPTARNPLQNGTTTIRRAKTLTRPERSVAPVPLINPQGSLVPSASGTISTAAASGDSSWPVWPIFSKIVTFWAPSFVLSSFGGLGKDKQVIQAWREKMALCLIITILCLIIAFITVGTQLVLCPAAANADPGRYAAVGSVAGTLGVQGILYNVTAAQSPAGVNFDALTQQEPGQDITPLFTRTAAQYNKCQGLTFKAATDNPCPQANSCPLPSITQNSTFAQLDIQPTVLLAGYDWGSVANVSNYLVIDGAVLNMQPYFTAHPDAVPGDAVDVALRFILASNRTSGGKDGTMTFYARNELRQAVPCLAQRYYAGNIDKITPGCFVSDLFLYVGLMVILSLVLVRFAMACVFNWFLSKRLCGPPDQRYLQQKAISPAVMPEGANISIDNKTGTAPWAGPGGAAKKGAQAPSRRGRNASAAANSSSSTLVGTSANPTTAPPTTMTLAQIGAELFAVCLVTCYSEGMESLRTTLDSISTTEYADARKLLFVVADGMITGHGEKLSTPDICVSLLDADERFGNPQPMSYIAIGGGSKAHNRAMVYAGHYTVAGRRTPTVIIVKCGTEAEAAHDPKPGNRGKRDSQLILMNFFSRVTYNDRMTPLDFDLFRKIHVLMGVTPDYFEVCLMVDADTKVFPDSLKYLVNCMQHDQLIMGVCGETRIANKRQSWVTAIQVFEYFISHHLAKAFESVFGGVTCLPGCFSMFRLKARRSSNDDWVPLIVKPEIIREYSQSEVVTLHQKNLLLLGEDRFLTTILLRTFPNRKMMFLPQARCRTVVPDTFAVLLSQRRRWINSTVHNLMELVRVRNLCGTFCFSMQFVVFMDLLGTVVLPIAIGLTYMLIVRMVLSPPHTFQEAIPLMLLVSVLGLPAVLILITTRKVVYVTWMMIYLVALPVWNFVLPVYAFWHFDDFSWGETRKVAGEGKDAGHGAGKGTFDGSEVSLRRWEDWERSRLRKIKREEKRRRDMERMHPGGFVTSENDLLAPPMAPGFAGYNGFRSSGSTASFYDGGSDTYSVASSDDDTWGGQIGGYNENGAAYPPPPVGLFTPADGYSHSRIQSPVSALGPSASGSTSGLLSPADSTMLGRKSTIGGAELEAMLDAGFDDARGQVSRKSTIAGAELEAMLDAGFDDDGGISRSASPSPSQSPAPHGGHYAPQHAQRYQLSDGPTGGGGGGYSSTARSASAENTSFPPSHLDPASPLPRSSQERWGPLGPLDPGGKF
ncbi:glycosyltransferase family 2 protein [Coniophora puteana RWD-64-598 SS2]|uniref:chitin synthase n=1 Tax=Coniophora puteana (strain RWD-64-598) TaxID=741705 RepID=A0A5M3MX16_CONPW|nr:glycosyltransferase family 2 protein [Coniophora puteana RWD-64-598 SS2]EIW83255.1 glycosyltransferase family 2 protein [Coniophora puteana RWD-64-598 SS2]